MSNLSTVYAEGVAIEVFFDLFNLWTSGYVYRINLKDPDLSVAPEVDPSHTDRDTGEFQELYVATTIVTTVAIVSSLLFPMNKNAPKFEWILNPTTSSVEITTKRIVIDEHIASPASA